MTTRRPGDPPFCIEEAIAVLKNDGLEAIRCPISGVEFPIESLREGRENIPEALVSTVLARGGVERLCPDALQKAGISSANCPRGEGRYEASDLEANCRETRTFAVHAFLANIAQRGGFARTLLPVFTWFFLVAADYDGRTRAANASTTQPDSRLLTIDPDLFYRITMERVDTKMVRAPFSQAATPNSGVLQSFVERLIPKITDEDLSGLLSVLRRAQKEAPECGKDRFVFDFNRILDTASLRIELDERHLARLCLNSGSIQFAISKKGKGSRAFKREKNIRIVRVPADFAARGRKAFTNPRPI